MDQSPAAAAQQLAVKKRELISAVQTGDTEAAIDLLDEGIPIDTKNNEGVSLLHWAASGGHVTTMKLLMITRRCDIDTVDKRGLTPLHSAAAEGQTKAVQELIRKGASKSVVAGMFGTPLHQATSKGHVETVVTMLDEGCPLDVVNSVGSTPLHWAAEGGHVELVRELVGRGCDVNAMKRDGCTPLHFAAARGRTEVVRELIKLGAKRSAVASTFGTPIDQAHLNEQVETVEALLEDEVCNVGLNKSDGLKALQPECNVIGTSASFGVTPVMSALLFGKVDMLKSLISKGGTIRDRDIYSLSTFEHCFVGGQSSELEQLCEACGIGSSGEGLKGALATLINQGLVDARKVLCLCAISGDSVFLEDQFIELFSHNPSAMPAALECAKFYFFNGVDFLNQLNLPDVLNPLQLSLLSFKCCKMGFATSAVELGAKNHTLFITKLLSHPVLKETVHEIFPNGQSPLDLARQFDLHDIATLIEGAGGRPVIERLPPDLLNKANVEYNECGHEFIIPGGQTVETADDSRLVNEQCQVKVEYASFKAVVEDGEHGIALISDLPPEIEVRHPLVLPRLKEAYDIMKAIAEEGEHGCAYILRFFSNVLQQPPGDRPPLVSAEQLSKDSILRQKPTLSKLTRLIVPQASTQNWKLVGLLLLEDIADCEATLNAISHQFSDDRNRFLETLSYWLEHGSSVTWKTLLDVLGHYETKHTVDELTDKIVSVLGGGEQVVAVRSPFRPVTSSALVVSGGAVAAEKSPPICEDAIKYSPLKPLYSSSWEMSEELPSPCAVQALEEEGRALSEQPLIRATYVQVVQEHAKEFLKEMNCEVIAPQLRALELIPENVKYDILHSKSRGEANAHLLNYLKADTDEETARKVFSVASEGAGYGRMNTFAAFMLEELQ